MPWRPCSEGVLLRVRATPRASKDVVGGVEATAEGPALQVKVRAVADKGLANAAIAAVVARWLGLAPSRVSLARGGKSRVKTLLLRGEPAALIAAIESTLAAGNG